MFQDRNATVPPLCLAGSSAASRGRAAPVDSGGGGFYSHKEQCYGSQSQASDQRWCCTDAGHGTWADRGSDRIHKPYPGCRNYRAAYGSIRFRSRRKRNVVRPRKRIRHDYSANIASWGFDRNLLVILCAFPCDCLAWTKTSESTLPPVEQLVWPISVALRRSVRADLDCAFQAGHVRDRHFWHSAAPPAGMVDVG